MKSFRDILISALALMLIAGIVTAALAGTNALTKNTIALRTEQIENEARAEVIKDATSFEKNKITANGESVVYYVGMNNGAACGYVFTVSSVGKSSGLMVMVGIGADGAVQGVKITDDNETAGYVGKIEKDENFLPSLLGKTTKEEVETVDAVSQATKTSNGVRKAVTQALEWYQLAKGVNADE